MNKTGRAATSAIGFVAAVTDEIEAEFTVGGFGGGVAFSDGCPHAPIGHDDFKVVDAAFDGVVDTVFVGEDDAFGGIDVHGACGEIFDGLVDDFEAFEGFFHADEEAVEAVAPLGADDVEVKVCVAHVWIILAEIACDSTGAGDGTSRTAVECFFPGEDADALCAFDEDAVSVEETCEVAVDFGIAFDEVPDLLDEFRGHVVHQSADAGVAGCETCTADCFKHAVEIFTFIESVEECGEGTGIEGHCSAGEEVIADAREFGEDCADVVAAFGDIDIEELLDRMMPGDIVGKRREVVHSIGDGDILIVVQVFADFFETAVQVADVGYGADDGFAFDLKEKPQGGMSRGVLRTEVQSPAIFVFDRFGRVDCSGHVLTFSPLYALEVVSFAPAAEGVILAERESLEGIGHENAPEVGVALEDDSEHVVDFAFHPVCAFPERDCGGNDEVWFIEITADDEFQAGDGVCEGVDHAEAVACSAEVEVVHAGEIDEKIESAVIFEEFQPFPDAFGGDFDAAIDSGSELRITPAGFSEATFQSCEKGVVFFHADSLSNPLMAGVNHGRR